MTADDSGLSLWLTVLGFAHNPFGHPRAEKSQDDMLQKTYVYDKTLESLMRDPHKSVVFLAPFGGGKTAARRYTSFWWESEQPETLVVIYKDFSTVARALPNCNLADHIEPIMRSIATAVAARLTQEPERYTQLIAPEQEWWLRFFRKYAISGLHNLLKSNLLLLDFIENSDAYQTVLASEKQEPFAATASLSDRLTQISAELHQLRFYQLLILVDEVDDHPQGDELADMQSMLNPLFSVMSIYNPTLWKFFVPDMLTTFIDGSAARRKHAIKILPITWTKENVKKFLKQRLDWASEGEVTSLNEMTADESFALVDLDEQLVELAIRYQKESGIPRTLLEMGELLIKFTDEQDTKLLTKEVWDKYLVFVNEKYRQS